MQLLFEFVNIFLISLQPFLKIESKSNFKVQKTNNIDLQTPPKNYTND